MEFEFVIPLKKEDLLIETSRQYCVRQLIELPECLEKLDEIKFDIHKSGSESVLIHFDTLFSLLYEPKDISYLHLNDIFDTIICKLLQRCYSYVEEILSQELVSNQMKLQAVNVIKMTFFIFSMYLRTYEEKMSQKTENLIADSKRGKGTTKKIKDRHINADMSWDWNAKKKLALTEIFSFLKLEISPLWQPPIVEDELINLIANCCYKVYENQEIIQAKLKPLRDSAAHILALLVQQYNHGIIFIPKIVQILKHHEHSASVLSNTVLIIIREYNCSSLLPKVLKELCEAVQDEEVAGFPKTASTFITDIVESEPMLLLPSIKILSKFLPLEPYATRIAVLVAFTELIECLSQAKDPSPDIELKKEVLFKILLKHIHDQNTYVRSKVFQLLIKLANDNKIPQELIIPILQSAKHHITDKSSYVSKNSILFFKVILLNNPYAEKFVLSDLRTALEKKTVALNTIGPNHVLSREELWQKSEPQLIIDISKALENEQQVEEMTQDDEDIAIDIVMTIIHKLIKEECFVDALNLLRKSEVIFPNSVEIRCNLNKENHIVDYYVAALKKVFLTAPYIPSELDSEAVNTHLQFYKKLKESIKFAELMNEAGKDIYKILFSKSNLEVIEAIGFFTTAFHFGVANAREVVRNMLLLIKNQQAGVKDAIADAYKNMYFMFSDVTSKAKVVKIVHRVIKFVEGITRDQKCCFEELIRYWAQKNEIDKEFITGLWDKFFKKIPGTSDDESAVAALILDMLAKVNIALVVDNLTIISEGLNEPENLMKVEYTCNMIAKLGSKKVDGKYMRYSSENKLFPQVINILVTYFDRIELNQYNNTSIAIINMIFEVCFQPETVTTELIKQLYGKMLEISPVDDSSKLQINEQLLLRFLCIYGHIIFRKWQYLDRVVFNNLRKCKDEATPAKVEAEEDEFQGDSQVAADDALQEIIVDICDKQLLEKSAFNQHIINLIVHVCSRADGIVSPALKNIAALTLVKLMMISQSFCEKYIQLYVTLMDKSKDEVIRGNLVLGFTDMTSRFPNVIEPWTVHLYSRLKDKSVFVRKNAVAALAHLILREMVKVRGPIAELALCLEDPETVIADQVKGLMVDISQKGNTLYNVVPDIISKLSNPERPDPISVETFNNILRYILALVTKERQNDLLVEKLCTRLCESNNDRQCQDLAFCLAELTYSEKSLNRLIECLSSIRDKLSHPSVYSAIITIINNCQKSSKSSLKEMAVEGSNKLERLLAGEDSGDEISEISKSFANIKSNVSAATPRNVKNKIVSKSERKPNQRTARRAKTKIKYLTSDSDSSDSS